MNATRVVVGLALAGCAGIVAAQGWKPERAVELTAPATAGGSLDNSARTLHRLWDELKLVPVPTVVANRAGGAHAVAYNHLHQKAGDPHQLSITSATILTGHINGRLQLTYTDFTPLGVLLVEHIAFAVRSDSPLRSGRDLVEALRKAPGSLSIALGNPVGSTTHIALGLPLQSAGVDVKQLKLVSFNSSGEAVTALLGGHVDVAVGSTVNVGVQVEAGKLRALATSSPRRIGGVYAALPTWAEQGQKGVFENWRGVIGARGMNAEQSAYWEGVLRAVVQSESFQKDAARNQWDASFRGSAEMRAFLGEQYAQLRSVMSYLGIVK